MTFVVALVWGRGVLVTSDSRASTGYLAREERKIHPIIFYVGKEEFDIGMICGSGDVALIKQCYQKIEEIFKEWFFSLNKPRNPNEKEFEMLVGKIESYLIDRFNFLRANGITPEITLILASVTLEGKPKLYRFDSRGIAEPLHENPGYVLIGSGTLTGGLLLLKLLNYSPFYKGDRGLLSSFLIDVVSEVDTTVSPFLGESIYIRYNEEEKKVVMGALTAQAIKELKWKNKWRRKLIETLWLLADQLGEEKLVEALERIGKGIKDKEIKEKIEELKKIQS